MERAEAVRRIGHQIGISRLVCAMHYPSDVAAGEAILSVVVEQAPTTDASGAAVVRSVCAPLPHGLHARPAARIAACAKGFDARVTLRLGERRADAPRDGRDHGDAHGTRHDHHVRGQRAFFQQHAFQPPAVVFQQFGGAEIAGIVTNLSLPVPGRVVAKRPGGGGPAGAHGLIARG